MKKKNRQNQGFTLVELLVVVMIIGILATFAIPKFANVTDSAKVAKIQGDLHTLGTAVTLYQAETGKYPTTLADLVNHSDPKKGYLQVVPKTPDDKEYNVSKMSQTGEITYIYDGVTYSSFGTKTR